MAEAVSWLDLGMTMIEPTASENPAPLTRLHEEEPLILDLPDDVPRSFRGFRDAPEPSPRNVSLLRLGVVLTIHEFGSERRMIRLVA
jgi:hypothetical protein